MNTIIHRNPITLLDDITFNNIDEKNDHSIREEIERLRKILYCEVKGNPENIPSPLHIRREDFSDTIFYSEAKKHYRQEYTNSYNRVKNEIDRLTVLNREVVLSKIEEEYQKSKHKNKMKRQENNHKYYQRNRDKLKQKAEKVKRKEIESNINEHNKILCEQCKIIKPVCVCGKPCDVLDLKNIKTHSKSIKHKLMKSIIGLVKYKRQFCRIKPVIKKINRDLKDYKKVVRIIKPNGKSGTMTNKTETETYCLFNDMIGEVDENNYIYREPYINKVEYTKKYQDNVFLMRKTYQKH